MRFQSGAFSSRRRLPRLRMTMRPEGSAPPRPAFTRMSPLPRSRQPSANSNSAPSPCQTQVSSSSPAEAASTLGCAVVAEAAGVSVGVVLHVGARSRSVLALGSAHRRWTVP